MNKSIHTRRATTTVTTHDAPQPYSNNNVSMFLKSRRLMLLFCIAAGREFQSCGPATENEKLLCRYYCRYYCCGSALPHSCVSYHSSAGL